MQYCDKLVQPFFSCNEYILVQKQLSKKSVNPAFLKCWCNSAFIWIVQGEKDCQYYMRTGSCKFAATCKFNHPEPAGINALMTVTGSSAYPSNVSAGAPSPHPFPTGVASWSLPRAQYVPSSRFQRPSNFTPLIVQPQNMVSVPGWSPYQVSYPCYKLLKTFISQFHVKIILYKC